MSDDIGDAGTAKASLNLIRQWLARLATLIAMDKPIANLEEKLHAIADVLHSDAFPKQAFTPRSLKSAAARFGDTFPDYKHLADHCSETTANLDREKQQRSGYIDKDEQRRMQWARTIMAEPERFNADARRVAQWYLDGKPPDQDRAAERPRRRQEGT